MSLALDYQVTKVDDLPRPIRLVIQRYEDELDWRVQQLKHNRQFKFVSNEINRIIPSYFVNIRETLGVETRLVLRPYYIQDGDYNLLTSMYSPDTMPPDEFLPSHLENLYELACYLRDEGIINFWERGIAIPKYYGVMIHECHYMFVWSTV